MDLHQAIIKGDFLLTRRLVEAGADVNVIDNERRTPLMVCCLHDGESRALAVARILLMHGARVGLCDGQGRNALMYSVLYERLGITKLFLEALDYDLNYTDREGCTALLYAAKVGNSSLTRMLLKAMKRYGLEVDKPDKEGVTPLILSCRLGHKQCAADLRSLGQASDSIKDKIHGKTAKDWELHLGTQKLGFRRYLPYKTLPKDLWEKREKFYKGLGHGQLPQPKTLPTIAHPEKKKGKEAPVSPRPTRDWRSDMRSLTEALQNQISPSYRSLAKPLPPLQQTRRRNLHLDCRLDALLQQRRGKGRKMSFDAISDALLQDSLSKKTFRRRCSVAVIPLIRLSARRRHSAHSSENGAEDKKSLTSLGKATAKV